MFQELCHMPQVLLFFQEGCYVLVLTSFFICKSMFSSLQIIFISDFPKSCEEEPKLPPESFILI